MGPLRLLRARLRRRDVAWFLVGVAGLLLFWETTEDFADGLQGLSRYDEGVHEALRPYASPEVVLVMATVSDLGSFAAMATVLAVAVLILLARGHRREALRIPILAVLNEAMVWGMKAWFARPRPQAGLVSALGFSYPSGHAAAAALFACLMGWLILRGVRHRLAAFALLLVAFLWILLVAVSRLLLGVHYLSDVVAGAGLGLAVGGFGMAGFRVASVGVEAARAAWARRPGAARRSP
ncbi:MAG TPA: phosphatase PAP2 family protein [Candidatus Thermoplasmatota archaeon]|nr:phosphatase PAP2 family protein [Candidatus Thermoplasmatota archaeon]